MEEEEGEGKPGRDEDMLLGCSYVEVVRVSEGLRRNAGMTGNGEGGNEGECAGGSRPAARGILVRPWRDCDSKRGSNGGGERGAKKAAETSHRELDHRRACAAG